MEQWLATFKQPKLWWVQKETRNYLKYNAQRVSRVVPDSPTVNTEHYFVLWDDRELAGTWQHPADGNTNSYFDLYMAGIDSASKGRWMVKQSLPGIVINNKDNCAPLYEHKATLPVSKIESSYEDEQNLGSYKLYRYDKRRQSENMYGVTFNPKSKTGGVDEDGVCILTDANGLVRYMWDGNYIYKISYRN